MDPVTAVEGEAPKDAPQELPVINVNVITPDGQSLSLQITPADTVQDIRQYLIDAPETIYVTSYHLEHNGQAVIDFQGLDELELKDGASLVIVEDPYNEASARFHVNRLKEILMLQPAARASLSPAMFSEVASGTHSHLPVDVQGLGPQANSGEYLSASKPTAKCVKKLCYSGWNPVRGNRRLQGDLFYLDLETLEGETFTITAWSNGYYVNASKGQTEFNPAASSGGGHRSHSLVGLLKQISPKFTLEFGQILNHKFQTHPYEHLPVPFPITNWLHQAELPTYDLDQAEAALTETAESDFFIQGQYHDWNEELQSCREHSRATQEDRITRDRGIFRVYADFVEAATRGAVATVDGNVPPINPTEEKKVHMYIYNNIFFSYAVDSRDFFKDIGGDVAAYKSASHDLLGVRAYDRADIEKLYTLATAIVDYRGYRIVAQSIVPGLFSGLMQDESAVEIVYGTLDGKKIKADPGFHEVLSKAATKLSIKTHSVVDSEGTVSELASHADIKGIRGSDGRMYVLDLVRYTPRDANYPQLTALLRPELIEGYLKVEREKEHAKLAKEMGLPAEFTEPPTPEQTEKLTQIEKEVSKISISLNVDALSQYKLNGTDTEVEQDIALVKTLSTFLKETKITQLVADLSNKAFLVDGQSITNEFHLRGINMRYLGYVTKLVGQSQAKSAFLELVLFREMITRVMKHIFADYLKKSKDYNLSATIAEVLNAFFGRTTRGGKGAHSGVKSASEIMAESKQKEAGDSSSQKPPKNKSPLPDEGSNKKKFCCHRRWWLRECSITSSCHKRIIEFDS